MPVLEDRWLLFVAASAQVMDAGVVRAHEQTENGVVRRQILVVEAENFTKVKGDRWIEEDFGESPI